MIPSNVSPAKLTARKGFGFRYISDGCLLFSVFQSADSGLYRTNRVTTVLASASATRMTCRSPNVSAGGVFVREGGEQGSKCGVGWAGGEERRGRGGRMRWGIVGGAAWAWGRGGDRV